MQADSLSSEPQGNPMNSGVGNLLPSPVILLTQELNQGLLHGLHVYSLPAELPQKPQMVPYTYAIFLNDYKFLILPGL